MSLENLSPAVNWLSDDENKKIYTSEFWNDLEQEKSKPWYILDNNFEKLWNYLIKSKLYDDYLAGEKILKDYAKK